jgi:diguanylate cyclase (GGDEF)-like protein
VFTALQLNVPVQTVSLVTLDMATMTVADIFVTALLGLMLLFAWLQSRAGVSLGWWGAAYIVQACGLVLLVFADRVKLVSVLEIGIAFILASYALMWVGARAFDDRSSAPITMFAGVAAWLVAAFASLLSTPTAYFMLFSVINASYCFAIAADFWRGRAEPLTSRWPAIVLMCVTGLGFLSWVPLSLAAPFPAGNLAFPANWFATVILVTVLGKIAMAFIILAMAKERLELRQRTEALTDQLTGLPNRRAFFRQALRRMRPRDGSSQPVSVLMFDLDHFKSINDRFGHGIGDRVLKLFADTLFARLKSTDVIGRVGGEEFAALLPDADMDGAARAAERVRQAFEDAARVIEGTDVGATVSVGAVTGETIDSSLHLLIERADVALYAAKEAGRNCVKGLDAGYGIRTAVVPSLVPEPMPAAVSMSVLKASAGR